MLESVAARVRTSRLDTPWKKLKDAHKNAVLYGTGELAGHGVATRTGTGASARTPRSSRASIPWLERRHQDAESDRAREQIEGYMREVPCPACGGARLRPASLAVTIGDMNIYEVGELSIREGCASSSGRSTSRSATA